MATHIVIAALSGLLLLAVFILTVGDPTRAMAVWMTGAAAGGMTSMIAGSSPGLRRFARRLIRA